MQKYQHFQFTLIELKKLLKLFFIFLLVLSGARAFLFLNYSSFHEHPFSEILSAFILGLRLDASALAYGFAPMVLLLFLVWLLRARFMQRVVPFIEQLYFSFLAVVLYVLVFSDFAYFSFFGERATLMIFGVFDDDTEALIRTAWENYNVIGVAIFSLLFLGVALFTIAKVLHSKTSSRAEWNWFKQLGFFLSVIVLVGITGRGSFTLFPLAYNTPDPTPNQFLNNLSKNSVFTLFDAYNAYEKNKNGHYDLIKQVGYKGKIAEAFRIHTGRKDINTTNLLANIRYMTPHNETLHKRPPNVVVVMVESFGLPITRYESPSFDILGSLKKHFDEDTLFTRFFSASNGTIVSMEPFLLNITARPNSTPFGQGEFQNTSFYQASARVYQQAGYETSFVYGGDLSWRNVGNFMPKQGFDHVEGATKIAQSLGEDKEKISHDWGVFDGELYKYIEQKLKKAKKPQFIYIMTTNNHPPYTVPKEYKSHPLEFSEKLKTHITGDMELAHKRFRDYGYALDMAGKFMDAIKSSPLADNTVVAITADNNTVEGIMKYDDYYNTTKLIPFYLYLPKYLKPKQKIDTTVPSSHKDLFPTLYNLTLSNQPYTAIGTNLLDTHKLHCGFNDAGILIARDGGFKLGHALTKAQKECEEYYKATLAVTEYLVQSQKKK